MRDIPIIYSGAMVCALLREVENPGTGKTNTRRMLYSLRTAKDGVIPASASMLQGYEPGNRKLSPEGFPTDHGPNQYFTLTGWQNVKRGDRLWVRENLLLGATSLAWKYSADDRLISLNWPDHRVAQMVDWAHQKKQDYCPSIHMPQWASRLTLVVTATKIERLQAITHDECIAEGADVIGRGPFGEAMVAIDGKTYHQQTVRAWFHRLWDSLHGADAWDDNPWVVALTFSVHKINIGDMPKAEAA